MDNDYLSRLVTVLDFEYARAEQPMLWRHVFFAGYGQPREDRESSGSIAVDRSVESDVTMIAGEFATENKGGLCVGLLKANHIRISLPDGLNDRVQTCVAPVDVVCGDSNRSARCS